MPAVEAPAIAGILREPGAVLLISCYELGRQPLALASALATLEAAGYRPSVVDLAVDKLAPELIEPARLAILSVPMHTALRIGMRAAARIRSQNDACRIAFFGSYAGLNAATLFESGADYVLSGEFEEPLKRLVDALSNGYERPDVAGVGTRFKLAEPNLEKIPIAVPSRASLPALNRYARIDIDGETRVAGHTESSRGCRHLCRHCSIPPIYNGRFFVVPKDVVLEDIRNQVAAGARHITFGDPDFLNGPGHAVSIVKAMHEEFPDLTFDFTAKVEHLLHHEHFLPEFARHGCVFIVTAVESLSNRILDILGKGHTRADFVSVLDLTRKAGIALRPTWVAFTPWTTLEDYLDILDFIESEELIYHVDPVQLTLRLLIPPSSLLVGHPEVRPHLGPLAPGEISYTWKHTDVRMDLLQDEVTRIVREARETDDHQVFQQVRKAAVRFLASSSPRELGLNRTRGVGLPRRRRAPRLTEPWFC